MSNFTPISQKFISQDDYFQSLLTQVQNSSIPYQLKKKVSDEIEFIISYASDNEDRYALVRYVNLLLDLPWEKEVAENLDMSNAQAILDKSHHGLLDVKKRMLEYIATIILQRQNKNIIKIYTPTLFLLGLAGTGKTTFAKAIATVLGRPFVRIPFGGLSSAKDLRGVSRVENDSEPGAIIKAMRQAGARNPVILLDELDRINEEHRSEIMGVLIELLDKEQNDHFTDHFLDYPFDLSHTIFVATANNSNTIATAVLDRLETIQMPSYSDKEKIVIASSYLLPKICLENGIPEGMIKIEPEVFEYIARQSGFDPGIRSVERKIAEIVRKVAHELVTKGPHITTINNANRKDYLAD